MLHKVYGTHRRTYKADTVNCYRDDWDDYGSTLTTREYPPPTIQTAHQRVEQYRL